MNHRLHYRLNFLFVSKVHKRYYTTMINQYQLNALLRFFFLFNKHGKNLITPVYCLMCTFTALNNNSAKADFSLSSFDTSCDLFLHLSNVKANTCEVYHIRCCMVILVECSDILEDTNLYLRNGVFTWESARFSYCFCVIVRLFHRGSINSVKVYASTGPISFGLVHVHTSYSLCGSRKTERDYIVGFHGLLLRFDGFVFWAIDHNYVFMKLSHYTMLVDVLWYFFFL